jgi:hypothetical protein
MGRLAHFPRDRTASRNPSRVRGLFRPFAGRTRSWQRASRGAASGSVPQTDAGRAAWHPASGPGTARTAKRRNRAGIGLPSAFGARTEVRDRPVIVPPCTRGWSRVKTPWRCFAQASIGSRISGDAASGTVTASAPLPLSEASIPRRSCPRDCLLGSGRRALTTARRSPEPGRLAPGCLKVAPVRAPSAEPRSERSRKTAGDCPRQRARLAERSWRRARWCRGEELFRPCASRVGRCRSERA